MFDWLYDLVIAIPVFLAAGFLTVYLWALCNYQFFKNSSPKKLVLALDGWKMGAIVLIILSGLGIVAAILFLGDWLWHVVTLSVLFIAGIIVAVIFSKESSEAVKRG